MKKLLLLVLLCAQPSFAQVAFLNTNTMAYATASPATATMSVTASGSNRVAFATIAYDFQVGTSLSAVSYGAQAMTQACTTATVTGGGFTQYAEIWYLVNPPTGNNTLSITVSGTFDEIYYNLVAFTGAHQTTPVRGGTCNSASGAAPLSLVVTSNASDLTITVCNCGYESGNTNTNQTTDGDNTNGTFSGASDHATTAAASVTHTWGTSTVATVLLLDGFSIQVAGGAAAPVHHLMTLGAGN